MTGRAQALDFIGVMERFAAENRVNPNALKVCAWACVWLRAGCVVVWRVCVPLLGWPCEGMAV